MSVVVPLLLPQLPYLLVDPQGNPHPLIQNRTLRLMAWEISGKTASEGVSESVAKLITGATRKGSIANYKSSWGRWVSWCSKQQVDPTKCPINFVLDFLAYLLELSYEYSTINSYRSAISAYHDLIDYLPVGQHTRVCQLMTGV